MNAFRAKKRRGRRVVRGAFTLLEIILALAILAGSLAMMGEVVRLAARNAESARRLTQAELLAASVMAEIAAGITLAEPVQSIPFDWQVDWEYSIVVEPTEEIGLIAVMVTVAETEASGRRPIDFTLVRWMLDPDVELSTSTESSESGDDG